jgi:hypothetical protein
VPESPDDWLTSEQVAEWLQVPVRSVRAWRLRRVGPIARKIGRHVRYRRADVSEWILSGQSADTGKKPEPVVSLIRPPRSRRRQTKA